MDRRKLIVLLAYLKALVCGLLAGTALVTLHEVLPTIGSETVFGSPLNFAIVVAVIALYYGGIVVAVCTPIWMALGRFRLRQNYPVAAVLGFVATLLVSMFAYSGGTFDQYSLRFALPYGLYGALAGMACWWLSPARRPQ